MKIAFPIAATKPAAMTVAAEIAAIAQAAYAKNMNALMAIACIRPWMIKP